MILRYVERVSGYSRQRVTLPGSAVRRPRHITAASTHGVGFVRYDSAADVRLLAELDELHGIPCGAAAKQQCERMYRVHGDPRFAALSHRLVPHLYNLRKANGNQRLRHQL